MKHNLQTRKKCHIQKKMVGMALRLESAKIRKIGGTRRLHNRAILIYEVESVVEIEELYYVC